MSDPLPAEQRRASHADREAVVERLRDAAGDGRLTLDELEQRIDAAYAARTYAELEPLTVDLPDHVRQTQPMPRSTSPVRVTGRPGKRWSLAVMGGTDRSGRWTVGRRHLAATVMGGIDLDLRDAELESSEVSITVFALMGGVDVLVPEEFALDAAGFGCMGAFDESDKAEPAPAGAAVVKVRGLALMGGIDVRRRRRTSENELGRSRRPGELES